jgi:ribosomal protein L11 methyltransferase
MRTYLQLTIPLTRADEAGLLVALLSEAGFDGFEETDAELKAFADAATIDEAQLPALLPDCKYQTEYIAETNWNARWESSFEPVVVAGFCAIRAAFHAPVSGVQHEIVITPQMSFGTGHHATTQLMIAAMEHLAFSGKSVFDFGTGTGILAILAHRLGAAQVLAIDNDDWSITNAADNLAANGAEAVALQLSDNIPGARRFDIILANINKNILLAHMAAMVAALQPGGVLLMSGLLTTDQEAIAAAATAAGLAVQRTTAENGWIAVQCVYKHIVN